MANLAEIEDLIRSTMIQCCSEMEERIVAKVVTALKSDTMPPAAAAPAVVMPSPAEIQQIVHEAVQEAPPPFLEPDVGQFVPIPNHEPVPEQQIIHEPLVAPPPAVEPALIPQQPADEPTHIFEEPTIPPTSFTEIPAEGLQQPQPLQQMQQRQQQPMIRPQPVPYAPQPQAAALKSIDQHKFPAYIEGPPSLVYRPDGSVLFEAMVSSKLKEPPIIRWFFKGREILPTDRYIMRMKKMVGKFAIILIIKDPTQQDQGVYTVFASNSHGSSSQAQTYVQECVGKSFYKD